MSEPHPDVAKVDAYGPNDTRCKTCRWWWRPHTGYPKFHGGDEQAPAEDWIRECHATPPAMFVSRRSEEEIRCRDGTFRKVDHGWFGHFPLTFEDDGCRHHEKRVVATGAPS